MEEHVRTKRELKYMRESGQMLGNVLKTLKSSIEAGMTTADVDQIARKEIKSLGGTPAFFGYQGFPAAACVSINDEVVHGIPGSYEIKSGDLVSVDCGVNYRGMITDAAFTVAIGDVAKEAQNLVNITQQALQKGIDTAGHGVSTGDIGAAVQSVLESHNLGVVRDLVGHGVGRALHEEPEVPNFGQKGTGYVLQEGMTIAIEPMATLGDWQVAMDPDGWTIRTRDHSLSAHFEHSVLITATGAEILTPHD